MTHELNFKILIIRNCIKIWDNRIHFIIFYYMDNDKNLL